MFEKVVAAPADPILGLTEEFKKDTRADKIKVFTKTSKAKLPFLQQ